MIARERQTFIKENVNRTGRVYVSDLSASCDVTEETIRQDLKKLESMGALIRVHGGAIPSAGATSDNQTVDPAKSHFLHRRGINWGAKEKIASLALDLIGSGKTLFIDSSTSAAAILSVIPDTMELTVVTNSACGFSNYDNKNIRFISSGGEYNDKYCCFQGRIAKESIEKYNVDFSIIGAKAISVDGGIQDSDDTEAEIKKIMISHSEHVILLVDHSKFNKSAFIKLLEFDEVDYIITDKDPGEVWYKICEENNIKLIF